MTKIDIISGFLGAGKTTLIKKLLSEKAFGQEQLVLIENEFGEIGVDGGFLKDTGAVISEINSGCICCSLVGDFKEALKDVILRYAPDRVIIEPSGVGKLSDVIKAVEVVATEQPDILLNSFSVVVDAVKCKMYVKNFGEFFLDQVTHASCILLSRTQLLSAEKLQAAAALMREQNPNANIVTTPWDQLQAQTILQAMEHSHDLVQELMEQAHICPVCGCEEHEEEHDHDHTKSDDDHDHCHCHDHEHHNSHLHHHEHDHDDDCHDHHHHHHADDIFDNIGMETTKQFSEQTLREILEQLSDPAGKFGTVLRAKGMLPDLTGVWHHFDLTPEEFDIRTGPAETIGKICVIGTDLHQNEIRSLFS